MSCEHERAGLDGPALSSKVAPIKHALGVYHPITVAAALVERLTERGRHPRQFQWGEMTVWIASCPLDDPASMASCGSLSIREGTDGEALVQNMCPHPLAEIICDLMGVYPDNRQVLNEAYRNSRKDPGRAWTACYRRSGSGADGGARNPFGTL